MVDIDYEITKEEFVPMGKAKDILDKIEEKNYEQKLAFEHVKKFAKIKTTDAKKLTKSLEALELRKLKPAHIVNIIDLAPKDIEDLKVLFLHADIPFKDEDLEQIMEVIKNFKK